jgi:hypothetical protein
MIRNIVLGRVRADADGEATAQDRDQVRQGIAGILGLQLPGLIANHAGWDARLREGGWDFAITNDWQDAAAYRVYDADAEHLRYRQMIGAVCEQLARVQFEVAP